MLRIYPTLLLVLGACSPAGERDDQASAQTPVTTSAQPAPAGTGAATITPDDMRARIGILASDAWRGRATPSPGLDSAAAYIAREFERFGLKPAGDGDSYIQRYRIGRERAPNVVGILEGSDSTLKNTYIVLSAHIDHLGTGSPVRGDSIFNGADDDASGTSAVLEVAEALASLPERPKRSVVFLGVSGEERGLLGSAYYSEHPTVPLKSIIANINIDMIGRNAPDTLAAIGAQFTTLGQLAAMVAAANRDVGLTVIDDPWPQERLFFRSDHFNFARKEIPAIFFFSGLHEDYHQPSDQVERIDADKAARVARLAFYLTQELANSSTKPEWTSEGLREVRRLTRE